MRIPVLLAGVGLTAACSLLPAPSETPVTPAVAIEAPPEEVLRAVPAVFDSVGLVRGFADPESGGYTSVSLVNVWGPWIGPAEEPNLRCTGAGVAGTLVGLAIGSGTDLPVGVGVGGGRVGSVTVTVSTSVREVDGASEVVTRVRSSATPVAQRTDQASTPHCVSTGRLESRIHQLLQAELAGSAAL